MDNRTPSNKDNDKSGIFSRLMETLVGIGLGETMLRAGTTALSIILLGGVIWVLRLFYTQIPNAGNVNNVLDQVPTVAVEGVGNISQQNVEAFDGIPRLAQAHTIIPSRPRQEIVKYTVQEGDTVSGIADKYGLKPETILWGNYNILLDDPHSLRPGQELTILPTNGTYYEWQDGDGLNGVAKFFGVNSDDIIDYPGNHLNRETIGDYAKPNIKPGTLLIIPGGTRQFVSWSAPLGVTRENAAYARVLGPGACDPVSGGAVGFGTFVWPANRHYLSGFDYLPKINHYGIDIAGALGEGAFATDAGVIVYAGWNNYGYGNMVMIDHGNGFQSLYGHLSEIYVGCGQSVGQGDAIGAIGSTGHSSGPHLHFEIMTATVKINPWDVLPAP
jgi:murein DD-endopeptidase MepM/ murein hydrolase activator NlpD